MTFFCWPFVWRSGHGFQLIVNCWSGIRRQREKRKRIRINWNQLKSGEQQRADAQFREQSKWNCCGRLSIGRPGTGAARSAANLGNSWRTLWPCKVERICRSSSCLAHLSEQRIKFQVLFSERGATGSTTSGVRSSTWDSSPIFYLPASHPPQQASSIHRPPPFFSSVKTAHFFFLISIDLMDSVMLAGN